MGRDDEMLECELCGRKIRAIEWFLREGMCEDCEKAVEYEKLRIMRNRSRLIPSPEEIPEFLRAKP